VTLDETAARAVCMLNGTPFVSSWFEDTERVTGFISAAGTVATGMRVVGLFTGGTLAKEAQIILAAELGSIATSLDEHSAHILVDLGDDKYTVGRPHPMIAPESRTEILLELAEEDNLSTCGVLLVDLVLGHGSHLDPAGELVESVKKLRDQHSFSAEVVAVVIGTEADPQNLPDQITKLEDSGIRVFRSNSEAARYTAMLVAADCRDRYLKEVE
jgi:FdrA protein